MTRIIRRIRFLLFGPETWAVRWAIAGIHSHNWKWVTKWGTQPCGCVINPITCRAVLYNEECIPGDRPWT